MCPFVVFVCTSGCSRAVLGLPGAAGPRKTRVRVCQDPQGSVGQPGGRCGGMAAAQSRAGEARPPYCVLYAFFTSKTVQNLDNDTNMCLAQVYMANHGQGSSPRPLAKQYGAPYESLLRARHSGCPRTCYSRPSASPVTPLSLSQHFVFSLDQWCATRSADCGVI